MAIRSQGRLVSLVDAADTTTPLGDATSFKMHFGETHLEPGFWLAFSEAAPFGSNQYFMPCRPKYEPRRVEGDLAAQYEEEKPHIDPQATLAEIVAGFRYKPGWHLTLDDHTYFGENFISGWLVVQVETVNSSNRLPISIGHRFVIPSHGETRTDFFWLDWLNSYIRDVEAHERAEFFEVNGVKPYFPEHPTAQNGWKGNPYNVSRKI